MLVWQRGKINILYKDDLVRFFKPAYLFFEIFSIQTKNSSEQGHVSGGLEWRREGKKRKEVKKKSSPVKLDVFEQ